MKFEADESEIGLCLIALVIIVVTWMIATSYRSDLKEQLFKATNTVHRLER